MSAPRGGTALTLGLLLASIGAVAALIAFTRVMSPSAAPPPPPPPVAAPLPATPAVKDSSPMAFRDPDNTKRYLALREPVAKLRESIAALDKAKALPEGDLEAQCTAILAETKLLAGEGHSEVRGFADGAKRLCDYDRSLAFMRLVVRMLSAKPARLEEKRALCDVGARHSKRLLDQRYGDDEQAKLTMADLGRACL